MSQAQFPKEQAADGSFQRQEDAFRNWVEADNQSARFPSAKNRYHLYVSYACPWAHRILIARALKGLEDAIGVSVVDPIRNNTDGWAFTGKHESTPDYANGFAHLRDAYHRADPNYDGRATVPVLWDTESNTIVSNSDDDLLRILNTAFNAFAKHPDLDLYPAELRSGIDSLNTLIHDSINDGVYKAGFATSQGAYETAANALFSTLDMLETWLANSRFLFGEQLTETDVRLFVTLIRFDAVYHYHFKCNLKRLVDYPKLHAYTCDIFHLPGIAETVNFDHIRRHYYQTHNEINPSSILPVGPKLEWPKPKRRRRMSGS